MPKLLNNSTRQQIWRRFMSIRDVQRPIVLGIETSCDDTAIAIVSSDKKILASRTFVDREIQKHFGGINPTVTAIGHRSCIDALIDDCLGDVPCRISDLDGVAVSTRPGLVISLKVGVERALSLAKLVYFPQVQRNSIGLEPV
ncbi:hypothetical protein FO519_010350 [Halicephalobus sp. NKZ332]|nr:hypothetical protein FO519_010350 [Halicephalobus sp. NKZ332]